MLALRAALFSCARRFFAERGIMEVDTPALARYAVTDPRIQSIAVQAAVFDETWHLQTSPEYAMKRLLASGSPDIYQISPVFRDGECGRLHQPEFTLVEWYRRGFDLAAMSSESCALINTLGDACGQQPASCRQSSYQALFQSLLDIDPLTAATDELAALAEHRLDQHLDEALRKTLSTDRDLVLDLLMSHLIMPALDPRELTVVTHYPASQAALARLSPDDRRCAERFEIFFAGMELANGYRELTDAAELSQRFAVDREQRRAEGLADRRVDAQLMAAMEAGLPECSGVAIGFDRVLMAWSGCEDIRQVRPFGYPA